MGPTLTLEVHQAYKTMLDVTVIIEKTIALEKQDEER